MSVRIEAPVVVNPLASAKPIVEYSSGEDGEEGPSGKRARRDACRAGLECVNLHHVQR